MAKSTCSVKCRRSPHTLSSLAICKALAGLSVGLIGFSILSESGFTPRASAQIVPDGTLGSEASQVIPNVVINGAAADQINGGATRGNNLFHSFSQFNIGDGQRVYFANPTGIETILTRVTGADPSAVLGTIGVDGAANLFLLNPNGIYFGPNAYLDIGGSFFASTAGSLRFADGTEFSAVNPQAAPLLTVNVPIGAQLQTTQPLAAITNRGNLTVPGDLTLVGSNLDLQGHLQAGRNLTLQAQDTLQIRDTTTSPFLASARGSLLVQGNQGVDIFALNHSDSGLQAGRNLILRSDGTIVGDAHYWSGGNFRVETLSGAPGSFVSPHDPVIRADGDVSFTDYTGASLHIFAGGSVLVFGNITITGPDVTDGIVETVTLSDGQVLQVDGTTFATLDIRAGTTAFGCTPPACGLTGAPSPTDLDVPPPFPDPTAEILILGDILFTDDALTTDGLIYITNQYNPNGATTGAIQVLGAIDARNSFGNSSDLVIDSRDGLFLLGFPFVSLTNTGFSGNAGNVTLLAKTDLVVGTVVQSEGILGGAVTLKTNGDIFLDPASTINSTSIDGFVGGLGGNVTIQGNSLTLSSGASLFTQTLGQAKAGDINVTVQNAVSLEDAQVYSQASGFGDVTDGAGGNINVNARSLSITSTTQNAQLLTQTDAAGAVGNLTLTLTDSITLNNGFISTVVNTGATGQGGTIALKTGTLSLTNNAQLFTRTVGSGNAGALDILATGTVSLDNTSTLFSQVEAGATGQSGTLTLETTGDLLINNNTRLFTRTFGIGNARTLDVTVGGTTTLDGGGSLFSEVTSGATGQGGTVNLTTANLSVLNAPESAVYTRTRGIGNAGNLNLTVTGDTIVNKGTIFSATAIDPGTSIASTGKGGNVTFNTGNLLVTNTGRVLTQTETGQAAGTLNLTISGTTRFDGGSAVSEVAAGAAGAGGNLSLTAPSLAIANGGAIQAITGGAGNAGRVTLTVTNGVTLDGTDSSNQPSRITSQVASGAQGNGNNVTISARTLALTNGAQLGTTTFGQGRSGDVSLNILDTVSLTGESANGGVSSISAQSGASGAAGNLTVQTRQLTLLGGGQVTTTALDTGRGGNLTVSATESVNVSGSSSTSIRSGLFASSQGTVANAGSGGSVEVTTPRLTIGNGAQISASTAGSGQAGNIVINARDLLELDGTGTGIFASTATGSSGQGGSIFIDPIQVSITNNARISVSSLGSGNGGSIFLQGGDVTLDRGFITAETASGEGGNITMRVGDVFLLRNGSLVSATAGGTGNGGNLDINARFIVAPTGENSDIIANAFQGRGGNVLITTDGIFGLEFRPRLTPLNDITASSQFGLQGVVTIVTPNVDPSKGVVALPGTVVDASQQIAQGCRPAGEAGRFVATGRGGLPPVPGETIGGDALWEDTRVQASVSRDQGSDKIADTDHLTPDTDHLTPAQGWVMDDRGTVTLVAQMPKTACY